MFKTNAHAQVELYQYITVFYQRISKALPYKFPRGVLVAASSNIDQDKAEYILCRLAFSEIITVQSPTYQNSLKLQSPECSEMKRPTAPFSHIHAWITVAFRSFYVGFE